jgi:SAM-dependent methyltransferase
MSEPIPSGLQILDMMRCFQPSCVIGAAAELDLWGTIGGESLSAEEIARKIGGDLRATTILLDAVAALDLLAKEQGRYRVPGELRQVLTHGTPQTILPMVLHSINILRSWSQLAAVAKSGKPAVQVPSIRGTDADRAAFIAAMHSISMLWADDLVAKLVPPAFKHLLDVGGASGTWTMAFLRAVPEAKATIFDLPDAVAQARERMATTEFADRVTLSPGDFYADELPGGADFAWVSAICHQHSRAHNRELFAKVYRALVPGGRIAIRDIVLEPDRTKPRDGALFAVNMLVNTATGDTFTLEEYIADLQSAGFTDAKLIVPHEGMNAVVGAMK